MNVYVLFAILWFIFYLHFFVFVFFTLISFMNVLFSVVLLKNKLTYLPTYHMFQQVFSYNAIVVLPNLSPNQMFNEILSSGTGIMNTMPITTQWHTCCI